jgi:hypothetical protein
MRAININEKQLRDMYEANVDENKIAKVMGCNKTTLYRRMRKIGLSPSRMPGNYLSQNGYLMVLIPNHPFANSRGYVRQHRVVMEHSIGRFLNLDEVVHHINAIKTDNRIENLRLMSKSEHRKLESTGSMNNFYGRHHSAEAIAKIKEKRKLQVGVNASFFGRHHTEESKLKISLSKRNQYAQAT